MVNSQALHENSIFIKDTINHITGLYNIIYSLIQDIENSIAFSRLGKMHPSIMRTNDFFKELQIIEDNIGPRKLPLDINLNNVLLIEKLVKIESYSNNNRIIYVLHVPITFPFELELYHLYSVPIFHNNQFKAIITKSKFLAFNELYFAYTNDYCSKISSKLFLCDEIDLQEIKFGNSCEIELLNLKNTSTCQQTPTPINRPIIMKLDNANQWIAVLPKEITTSIHCQTQEEIVTLQGSYLFEIPINCQVKMPFRNIENQEHQTSSGQPVLFPKLKFYEAETQKISRFSIDDTPLDELQDLKIKLLEIQPDMSFSKISNTPSIWTIVIYVFFSILLIYLAYRYIIPRCCTKKKPQQGHPTLEPSAVQIPR